MKNKYVYAAAIIIVVILVSSIAAYTFLSKNGVSVTSVPPTTTPSSTASPSPTPTPNLSPTSSSTPAPTSTSTPSPTSASSSPSPSPSAPQTQTIVDQAGRTVTLPMYPNRIVVTAPWQAEVLLTFKDFGDIVGVPICPSTSSRSTAILSKPAGCHN